MMHELEQRYNHEFDRKCVTMQMVFYGGEWLEREVYVKLRCMEYADSHT